MKEHIKEAQKAHKEDREEKLERTRRGSRHDDVELANIFQGLGLLTEFMRDKARTMELIPQRLEGKRWEMMSFGGQLFLKENFDVQLVNNASHHHVMHFPKHKKGEPMRLFTQVAERSGQPRKVVKAVYEGLVKQIKSSLKEDRAIRLPDIGRVMVKYRKARPKRKGTNPFTGEKNYTFKAQPASNRVRISPARTLKVYVLEKLKLVAPKKKKE